MPRPCHCDRPACGLCTLYRDSPRHRAAWGADPSDTPLTQASPEREAATNQATPARVPCASLGEPIGGAEASRLGLSVLRQWRPCAKGHGEKGHVCQCDVGVTCAGCPDWTPAAE